MQLNYHKGIEERWYKMNIFEQMGNIGSEVGRAARWQNNDERNFRGAVSRALELFYFTACRSTMAENGPTMGNSYGSPALLSCSKR